MITKNIRQKVQAITQPDIQELGKVPPQARDLEEAVLCAVMIEDKALGMVAHFLKSEMFYVETHRLIYTACLALRETNAPVDLLTVAQQLRVAGVLEDIGGAYFLAQLTNKVGSAANVETHARIIYEMYLKREAILAGYGMMRDGYDATIDPVELVTDTITGLELLRQGMSIGAEATASMVIDQFEKEANEIHIGTAKLGIMTGLRSLDHKSPNGWRNGNLVIVAGRPGDGKTIAMLQLAFNQASEKINVGFISLEMSEGELVNRLLSNLSRIHYDNLYDKQEVISNSLQVAKDTIRKLPLYFACKGVNTIYDITNKIRIWVSKYKVGIVYVDYLQLVAGTGKIQNREQDIANVSRSLKLLAKDLGIVIVVGSQLNREVDKRNDRRPQLSDLRESGAIEQDADMVIMLWNPYKHEIYEVKSGSEDIDTKDKVWLIVAKLRNGKLGDCICFADYSKFYFGNINTDNPYSDNQSNKRIFNKFSDNNLGQDPPF
jgi:replicative DNA helicase